MGEAKRRRQAGNVPGIGTTPAVPKISEPTPEPPVEEGYDPEWDLKKLSYNEMVRLDMRDLLLDGRKEEAFCLLEDRFEMEPEKAEYWQTLFDQLQADAEAQRKDDPV